MAIPLWAIGAGLTGASLLLQNDANSKATKARGEFLSAERKRQDAIREEQRIAADSSIDNFSLDSVVGETADEKNSLLEGFDRATNIEPVGLGVSSARRDNSLIEALGRQDAKRASDKKMALAGLLSSGGALQGISRDNAFNAADIARLSNFSAGSNNVNNYELDYAKMLADSGLANLTGILGQAALFAAATQAPKGSTGFKATNTPGYHGPGGTFR